MPRSDLGTFFFSWNGRILTFRLTALFFNQLGRMRIKTRIGRGIPDIRPAWTLCIMGVAASSQRDARTR
jgi:hypothetical protein